MKNFNFAENDNGWNENFPFNHPEAKTELVKLIQSTLNNLGYGKAAKALEEESGVKLKNTEFSKFKKLYLSNNWPKCLDLVKNGQFSTEIRNSLVWEIEKMQYYQLILNGDFVAAANFL